MKIDFKGIIAGAWNSVFVKQGIEEIAEKRLKICNDCDENSERAKKIKNYTTFRPDFHCTLCGCNLHMKTRSLSQACPINKWQAELTEDEETQLENKLNEDDKDK